MKTIKILMIQVDGPIDIYGRFSHTFLGRLDLETAVLNSLILVFCVWALINTYKYLTVKCGITTEWLVNYLITMPQLNDLWKFIQCKIYGRFRHSRTKFMFAWAIQSIASDIFCCCHCSCRQIALHYASALNVELHLSYTQWFGSWYMHLRPIEISSDQCNTWSIIKSIRNHQFCVKWQR